MNKASVSKKALSVFLSVLMALSCCVTATPWLADTFGVKADAATTAQLTALDNAVKKAIQADGINVLNSGTGYATTGDGTATRSITDNSEHGVIAPIVKALADIMANDAAKATENADSNPAALNTAVKNIVNGRTFSTNSTENANARTRVNAIVDFMTKWIGRASFEKYWNGSAPSPASNVQNPSFNNAGTYSTDSNLATGSISISVSRTKYQAIKYYSLNDLPTDVQTSFTFSYGYGRGSKEVTWTYKDGCSNKNGSQWFYYNYINSVNSGAWSTQASDKAKIQAYLNYFTNTLVVQDPYSAYANETELNTVVAANKRATDAFWGTDADFSSSAAEPIPSWRSVVNHFGGQVTLNGQSVSFQNAIDTFVNECSNAANYYKVKPTAQDLMAEIAGLDSAKLCRVRQGQGLAR